MHAVITDFRRAPAPIVMNDVVPVELALSQELQGKPRVGGVGEAKAEAILPALLSDGRLTEVVARWPQLSEVQRDQILAVCRSNADLPPGRVENGWRGKRLRRKCGSLRANGFPQYHASWARRSRECSLPASLPLWMLTGQINMRGCRTATATKSRRTEQAAEGSNFQLRFWPNSAHSLTPHRVPFVPVPGKLHLGVWWFANGFRIQIPLMTSRSCGPRNIANWYDAITLTNSVSDRTRNESNDIHTPS
jgi:hypothetical protein